MPYKDKEKEKIKRKEIRARRANPENREKERIYNRRYQQENKDAKTAYMREWRKANADLVRAYERAYYNENRSNTKEKRRDTELKKSYGISLNEFNELFKLQDNKCANRKCSGVCTRWGLDHDHKTGKVRGILCSNCNTSLGLVKDSVDVLEGLIGYLKTNSHDIRQTTQEMVL